MQGRIKRTIIVSITLIVSLALLVPINSVYIAYASEDLELNTASAQVNSPHSIASLALADPEPWRFAFTRFTNVYPTALQYAPTSIALDSRNFPHISFVEGNFIGLKHAFYNGVQWMSETVDEDVPRESAIVVDSQDRAHITYTEYTWGGWFINQARVKYAHFNGSVWANEVIDEHGFWSSIALDSLNNPHIAYFNGSGLQYAVFDGFTWTKRTVDSNSLNGLSIPTIALDSQDRPRIAYSGGLTDTPKQLKYASFNGSSWNIQTIDGEGFGASMILDTSSNTHISYYNGTALKYATFDGTSWNIQAVTTTSTTGASTSIAMDSEFRPHIVYESGGLKYAYYVYNSWNITTINEYDGYDPGPWPSGGWYMTAGVSPSLKMGSDNKLRLSYIAGKYVSELRYAVGTKQYLTNLEFTDDSGTALYAQPSRITVNCPEEPSMPSRSVEFTEFSNRWLNIGNWTLMNVTWQESEVEPLTDVVFNPVLNGTWKVKTRVYSLNIKNKDQFDNLLAQSVTLTFLNTTVLVKQPIQGWINMTQVQTGTIMVDTPIQVSTSERYVLMNPNITLSENTMKNLIWRHEITTLKVSLDSSTTYVGFHVNITGRLTHTSAGNIPDANIILTYRVPGVPEWNLITSTSTKPDGTYNIIWIPSATGYYTLNASWTGNDNYLGASSIINLAVVPVSDGYVFSVTSNSTISALSFNSTKRELNFTVSGSSGTTGYVDATVAKTLIPNIADVKVFLDGEETTYAATSTDNSWLIHFTYQHSTHTVTISLGTMTIFPTQLITLLSIGFLTVVLAVATLLIYKRRKKSPSSTTKC